jgi:hypothetical protein
MIDPDNMRVMCRLLLHNVGEGLGLARALQPGKARPTCSADNKRLTTLPREEKKIYEKIQREGGLDVKRIYACRLMF